MDIALPHNFVPRWYQVGAFNALAEGYKRIVCVWHRRAGKDKTLLNIVIKEALKRVGSYYYFYPQQNQVRRALWQGMDKDSFPFLGHIPDELIEKRLDQEMLIQLKNGSILQFIGTDKIDALMSTNPVGCVFSEYSLQKPEVWDFIRPILRENEGWAMFNFTPRGHNHGYDIYQMARSNPDWYCERFSACKHPIYNPTGEIPYTSALKPEDIDAEKAAGMSDAMIRQEFFVDFDVSGDDILIPLHLVEAAIGRNVEFPEMPRIMGVDVGMSLGGDPSAIVIRQGGKILHLEEFRYDNTLQVSGRVRQIYQEWGCKELYIDAISWGAGVAHTLQGWGLPVFSVNVGESSSAGDKYNRLRDELWWKCREFWEARDCCIVDGLELTGQLIKELTGPTYSYTPAGKVKVESKDELKKRNIASPNIADALCLTMQWTPQAANFQNSYHRDQFIKRRTVAGI